MNDYPLRLDPRLSDHDAAVHVAKLMAAQRGLPTPPEAGVTAARARTAKRRLDDDLTLTSADIEIPTRAGTRFARVYRPAETKGGVVLFLHGGGWALGDLEMNDALCRELCTRSGATFVSLDYRLAPEHPFPAAVDDAADALKWLAGGGSGLVARPSDLAVAGHSAGGNIAAVLARRSRDGELPPVAHQLLLCPVLDSDTNRSSYWENESGLPLTREEMIWYWDLYLPDLSLRSSPDSSPLRILDATGLASTTLIVAEADPLRDEGLAYAELLAQAGVPVETILQRGVPHLFLTFPKMPGRDEALEAAARGVRRAFAE